MDSEKLEYLRKCMKEVLSDSRYRHVIGVEEVCHDLALIYGVDVESACIAGILHDCAKYMTGDDMIRECVEHGIEISKIERKLPHMLLHSKVGAVYAREKYGINDEDILNAINFIQQAGRACQSWRKYCSLRTISSPTGRTASPG